MSVEKRVNLILWLCLLAVVLAIGGLVLVGVQGQRVIDVVQTKPKATRTLWVDWTCKDGESVHVEATSEVNEPREAFFQRFDGDVAEREKDHPRR